MFIINQDRDKIYNCEGKLYASPAIHKEKLLGINLYDNKNFLGTFDSIEQIMDEINKIVNFKSTYYCVNGYSDFDIKEKLQLEKDN